MLKSKCLDKEKMRPQQMLGWYIDGKPVKRQKQMIYWYSWGRHTFDIRTMRIVLGLPKEHPADNWFMAKNPDPCGSFEAIMMQLENALNGKSFKDAMEEHDKLMRM